MPKQSFLTTDFFIVASESDATNALLSLPHHHSNIHLLKENSLLHSMRFLYEHQEKSVQNYIDVSVLPLNDQYVHFSLHGSYTNGKRIQTDPDIGVALQQFEQALHTLLKSEAPTFVTNQKRKSGSRKPNQFMATLKLLLAGKQVQL